MARQSILLTLLLFTFINNLIVAKSVISLENHVNVTDVVHENSTDKVELIDKKVEKNNGSVIEVENEDELPQDKTSNGQIEDEEVENDEEDDIIKDQGGGVEDELVENKYKIESRENEETEGAPDTAAEIQLSVPSSISPFNGNLTLLKIKTKEMLEELRNKNNTIESKLRQIFRKRPILTRKDSALPFKQDIEHNNPGLRNHFINKMDNDDLKLIKPSTISYLRGGLSDRYYDANNREIDDETEYENNDDDDDNNFYNDYQNYNEDDNEDENDDDSDSEYSSEGEVSPNVSIVEDNEENKDKNNVAFEVSGKITRKGITYFLGPNNVVYAMKKESTISKSQLKDQEDEPDNEIYINVGREAEKIATEEKGPNGENICRYGKVAIYTYGKCDIVGGNNSHIIKIGNDESEKENERKPNAGTKVKKTKKHSKGKRQRVQLNNAFLVKVDKNTAKVRKQAYGKQKRKINPTEKRIMELRKEIEKELKKMEKQRKKNNKKNQKNTNKTVKKAQSKQKRKSNNNFQMLQINK